MSSIPQLAQGTISKGCRLILVAPYIFRVKDLNWVLNFQTGLGKKLEVHTRWLVVAWFKNPHYKPKLPPQRNFTCNK